MIKAKALKPVVKESVAFSNMLAGENQNITIVYSDENDQIPKGVQALAYQMFRLDYAIRDLLTDLRSAYGEKKEYFQLSLRGVPKESKDSIIDLFLNHLFGVTEEVWYCKECDQLNGKLVFSQKAQKFINGQYMEIGIRKLVEEVLEEFGKKYKKEFKVYANTKVSTLDKIIKNEFDLIIENVDAGIIYVIEVKSGKNFREFKKLKGIKNTYKIADHRLLLIDNYLTDDQAETIEYFYEYFCTNSAEENLKKKLITMLERDL